MITAIDTNILLDILVPGSPTAEESESRISESLATGSIILSEPVLAEIAGRFASKRDLEEFLQDFGLQPISSTLDVVLEAGRAWTRYSRRRPTRLICAHCGTAHSFRCSKCGELIRPRQHVIADFLIGAHALLKGDQMLTRDRGYYRRYFPGLKLA